MDKNGDGEDKPWMEHRYARLSYPFQSVRNNMSSTGTTSATPPAKRSTTRSQPLPISLPPVPLPLGPRRCRISSPACPAAAARLRANHIPHPDKDEDEDLVGPARPPSPPITARLTGESSKREREGVSSHWRVGSAGMGTCIVG